MFAREVIAGNKQNTALPYLLWLQGGPGGKAERPAPPSGWLTRALQDYRVILLDQRGTGRSTPANRQTLAARSPAEQAEYLTDFRADSIVKDAEILRQHLTGGRPWSVLGQSFGGFCALSYLSFAPQGLSEVMITGGLPTLTGTADDVYRAAYARAAAKNAQYYARYPADIELAHRVADHLTQNQVIMPTGERLTLWRFQTLGITLGTTARFDSLHFLLEEAFVPGPDGPELADSFLQGVDALISFADRPLYAAMHEPTYAQHTSTRWAAHRVRDEYPAFDNHGDEGPVQFTGEMIYPWLFDEGPALVPLRECAQRLAPKDDWPDLYDPNRLAANEIPVVAAIYHDDMYVDRDHALQTARAVRGLQPWIPNQFEHDGIRQGSAVLDRLIDMLHGIA